MSGFKGLYVARVEVNLAQGQKSVCGWSHRPKSSPLGARSGLDPMSSSHYPMYCREPRPDPFGQTASTLDICIVCALARSFLASWATLGPIPSQGLHLTLRVTCHSASNKARKHCYEMALPCSPRARPRQPHFQRSQIENRPQRKMQLPKATCLTSDPAALLCGRRVLGSSLACPTTERAIWGKLLLYLNSFLICKMGIRICVRMK